jgi:hypothetical protein
LLEAAFESSSHLPDDAGLLGDSHSGDTGAGVLVGTLGPLSPEQPLRHPGAAAPTAEAFASG